MKTLTCNSKLHLEDLIGRGGMSEVYKARWIGVNGFEKPVAVKKILPEVFRTDAILELFQAEMMLCSKLHHGNVVQVFQNGIDRGAPFLVMEYLDGFNLKTVVKRMNEVELLGKKGLSVMSACYIISEVAKGLGYAHSFRDPFTKAPLNIVHRDISPDNIFLTYADGIKLVDFGIAEFTGRAELTGDGIRGKVRYLSPEQSLGQPLEGTSDVFSLGIVFYELLTGRHPFAERGTSVDKTIKAIRHDDPPPPSSLNPEVDEQLDRIVLRMLHKLPGNRVYWETGYTRKLSTELDTYIRWRKEPFLPAQLFDFIGAFLRS